MLKRNRTIAGLVAAAVLFGGGLAPVAADEALDKAFATLASYQADPTVKGWERAAALDDRVCLACIMLDGKLYSMQDEMDDHPNGRCTMLPHTLTFREMGLDVDEPDFSRELGQDWFERQDEATQREMMNAISKQTYDAWRDGLFQLEDIPMERTSTVWGDSWTPKPFKALVPVGIE